MMHMTFYWGKKVTLLVDSWKTDSWTSYVLSLLACLIVAVFYQFLENRRIRLKLFAAGEIQAPLLQNGPKLGVKLARALLFAVISAIGYLLMLAVMSFNFVAVVLGLVIGYFFFTSDGEDSTAHSCA